MDVVTDQAGRVDELHVVLGVRVIEGVLDGACIALMDPDEGGRVAEAVAVQASDDVPLWV
jgi:hypothetical protein